MLSQLFRLNCSCCAGSVSIDGVDVRSYNLRWLRSQIGLVSQEPLLFSMSVLDNIR
jgi:ABC-type multidrug transport system fused ATPase/permease subunit